MGARPRVVTLAPVEPAIRPRPASTRRGEPAARRSLDLLLDSVERLCDTAARECGRAAALCQRASRERSRSRRAQLANWQRDQYARVEGTVDGTPTIGIIRRDGSILGDRPLLERVAVVVAMRDSLADGTLVAGDAGSPLVSTLTTTRACDRVDVVEIFGAARGRDNHPCRGGSSS